jgi:hypothetical protein
MANERPGASAAKRRVRPQVEDLEGRKLLSGGGAARLQNSQNTQYISILTPGTYVSQQVSGFDVTIHRAPSNGPHNPADVPVTVRFTATLASMLPGGAPVALPASAGGTFTPVDETLPFPAGVTDETVHNPVNSGAPNPGMVPIALSISPVTPGISLDSTVEDPSTVVYLVTGPSALPPTPVGMTNAHLIVHGKTASGISITFSGPMSTASVEDVRNYSVSKQGSMQNGWDFFYMQPVSNRRFTSIPLKAAQYDPATNTVTLIPRKSLRASAVYEIHNASPRTQRNTLTDLQGDPVLGGYSSPGIGGRALAGLMTTQPGFFLFDLQGSRSLNWRAPLPPPIVQGK